MTTDQLMGLLRSVLMFGGGFALSRGWLNVEQLTTIVGALVTLAGVGWNLKANTKSSIIASATQMPEVNSSKLVAAIDDPNLKAVAKENATPQKE